MEPLDPELRRLVHDGMVQAVPDQAQEDRVLLGLLARLPQGGSAGGEGGEAAGPAMPRGGEGAAAAAKAGTAAGSKTWLWVVLGVTTVTGGFVLGGRREPERPPVAAQQDVGEPAARSIRAEPVSGRVPGPSAITQPPSVERAPATTHATTGVAPERTPANEGARKRPSPSPRTASDPVSAPVAPAPVAPAPAPDDLAAEVQQIAAADRALARGDARRALQLAREHATDHPHGQLGLEREAIELGARCQLAEPGATEAAAAFLREHASAPAAAKVRTRCPGTKP